MAFITGKSTYTNFTVYLGFIAKAMLDGYVMDSAYTGLVARLMLSTLTYLSVNNWHMVL